MVIVILSVCAPRNPEMRSHRHRVVPRRPPQSHRLGATSQVFAEELSATNGQRADDDAHGHIDCRDGALALLG